MPGTFSSVTPTKDWFPDLHQQSYDLALLSLPDLPGIRDAMALAIKNGGYGQPTRLSPVARVIIGKASPADPATIWISLENTQIASGKMLINNDDHKGWFQDRIDVELTILEPDGTPSTRFNRVSDGPQTGNGSSSTSSSISFTFSASGSIGFFGPTPTGSVGGSAGVSESHSFGHSLEDFRVENNSDSLVARHSYIMAASSGAAYNKAIDLAPDGGSIGLTAAFQGIKLYDPPPLATANLQLISQCVWQAANSLEVADTLTLRIGITQHVSDVDGTNEFFNIHRHSRGLTLHYTYTVSLPMAAVAQSTDALTEF